MSIKNGVDSAYIARCHKVLREWGAPLSDWHCVYVYDMADDDGGVYDLATCELCGCSKVRYVHVMRHDQYFEDIEVGCICAGIMEGDILAAKERERLMKNRAKRKQNFVRRKWKQTRDGGYFTNYRGKQVFIKLSNRYSVTCDGKQTCSYKNRPIDNFLSAAYAAFDLADPIEI